MAPRLDQRHDNTRALTALVLAFLFPPAGIVFGWSALRQLSGTPQRGRGLAIASIIIGTVVGVGFGVAIGIHGGGLRFSPGRDLVPAVAVVIGVIVGIRGWTSVQQHGPTQLWVGFGLAALMRRPQHQQSCPIAELGFRWPLQHQRDSRCCKWSPGWSSVAGRRAFWVFRFGLSGLRASISRGVGQLLGALLRSEDNRATLR